jgi:hypothetical protein
MTLCRPERTHAPGRGVAVLLFVTIAALGAVSCDRTAPEPQASPAPTAPPAPAPPPAPPVAPTSADSATGGDTGEIAEFPAYPGATRAEFGTETNSVMSTRTSKGEWTTTDPLARVKPYYQELVTRGGWTVTAFTESTDEAKWKLQRGGSRAEIEIDQDVGQPLKIEVKRTDPA